MPMEQISGTPNHDLATRIPEGDTVARAAIAAVNALLSEPDLGTGIGKALALIGAAADVDRVYIFENHPAPGTGDLLASQRYEWVRPGTSSQLGNKAMQNMVYRDVLDDWPAALAAGRPINGHAREFSEPLKTLLVSQDIKSILIVPITVNEFFWGFIGFDECRRERVWTADETTILTAISANIGHILLRKRTEESLRMFKAAVAGTGNAVIMVDGDGKILFLNDAHVERFGYTAEELSRAGGFKALFINPADHDAIFSQTMIKNKPWHGEAEMLSRQGRRMTMLLRTNALKDHQGRPSSLIGISTDITAWKETEKALHENEVRYRRLVEAITDYIYTVKVENGKAVSTVHGPNCVSVTGYSSEEYQADPDLWLKMVFPADRELVIRQAQLILEKHAVQPLEHRIYHKNGSVRWVRNCTVPHLDAKGRLVSYDGMIYDVTDRKAAEERLKEHARKLEILNRIITAVNRADNLAMLLEESLRASIEMIAFDGGGIHLVNPDGKTASLVCQRGLPEEFVRRCESLKLADAAGRMLFIEGKPIFQNDCSSLLERPEGGWKVISTARIPLVSKDKIVGTITLINAREHIFEESEKDLLLSIGRQIGMAVTKMRSENALRESENRYRTITEQSLVGIQIIKDGRLVFVNDGWARITGYSPAEIMKWGYDEYLKIVHPDDRSLFVGQARKAQAGIREDVMAIYDCRFLSSIGEVKWVSINSKAVDFADGRAIVGMIVDITERKLSAAALVSANKQLTATNEHLFRREQELTRANHDKEILLKEIHHRVKNNLQIINSLINLQIHNISDHKAVDLLKECQSRIKTIAMVHEKMYQFGNLARVDIGTYLENLFLHLGRMYLDDPARVTLSVSTHDVCLPIDQAIPVALLANELMSNSFKYAFPQHNTGKITINLAKDGNSRYVLQIGDNGVGLPPGTDYRKTASLGMQLVTTFATQLRGTIELDKGPGTSFTIIFPQSTKED